MMSQQCPGCGTYYTGDEAFCARCGAPRAANAFQQNPYGQPQQNAYGQPPQLDAYGQPIQQNAYGQPYQQQPQTFGQRLQNYYTPQRIVRRMIIGRLIGLGVALVILAICALFFFISVLGTAATQH